jgi:hypothetical protein
VGSGGGVIGWYLGGSFDCFVSLFPPPAPPPPFKKKKRIKLVITRLDVNYLFIFLLSSRDLRILGLAHNTRKYKLVVQEN